MTRRSRAHHTVHKRRVVWPWIVGIVAVLAAIVAAAGICGMKLVKQAEQVKDHETQALTLLSGLSTNVNGSASLDDLNKDIPKIQQETQAANTIAHGSLWNFAAKIPFIGTDISTVQGMTEVVHNLASKSIPEFVDVLNSLKNADLSNSDGINLQPVVEVQPKLSSTNKSLQEQVKAYDSLKKPNIEQIESAYTQGKDKLDDIAEKVNGLSNTFEMLPSFLGSGQSRTYAVMAMTTSEMRSSGGLIGSIGEMTADNGVIHIGDFQSNQTYLAYGSGDRSADMGRIFADEGPLHMSFDIRDLAVFPDTGQAATSIRSIWNRTPWGQNTTLDGVVMVDPVFVQELVKISGNVVLPNGTTLTGDNTAEYLLNTVYKQYGNAAAETDAIFGLAAAQVLSNMFKNINVSKLASVGTTMNTMAKERHFSMYVFDENLEKTIQQAGFTATTPNSAENPSVGIYLTEQNPSKMGWYIKRTTKVTTVSCDSSKGTTYHVEYTLNNTLKESEASQLPSYIVNTGQDLGFGIEKILFYPPKDGSITNLVMLNGSTDAVKQDTLDGNKIYRTTVRLAPEQRVTYSFDVTVSPKAQSKLAIDQTPMGWVDTGVVYEGETCSTEQKK